MNRAPTESVAPIREEAVAYSELCASIGDACDDWGFERATVVKLVMLGYLLDEESQIGADLNSIIDLVVKAEPRNHRRILAYLRDLTENLAHDPQADPRTYARKVLRGNGEPA